MPAYDPRRPLRGSNLLTAVVLFLVLFTLVILWNRSDEVDETREVRTAPSFPPLPRLTVPPSAPPSRPPLPPPVDPIAETVTETRPIDSPYWFDPPQTPINNSLVVFLIENSNRYANIPPPTSTLPCSALTHFICIHTSTNVLELRISPGLSILQFKKLASSALGYVDHLAPSPGASFPPLPSFALLSTVFRSFLTSLASYTLMMTNYT